MAFFGLFSKEKKLEKDVRRARERLESVQMRGVPESAAELGRRQMILGRHQKEIGKGEYSIKSYEGAAKNYKTAAKEAKGMEVTRPMIGGFKKGEKAARKSVNNLESMAG